MGWGTPRTSRQLQLQLQSIKRVVQKYRPRDLSIDVLHTIKGSAALALAAPGLERQLQRTKAAKMAKTARQTRCRRALDAGGGTICSQDARAMVERRDIDEVAAAEALLARKKERKITQSLNKWKKLRANIRNYGKQYLKRSDSYCRLTWLRTCHYSKGSQRLQMSSDQILLRDPRHTFTYCDVTIEQLGAAYCQQQARGRSDSYTLLFSNTQEIKKEAQDAHILVEQSVPETQFTAETKQEAMDRDP